jgi:phosphonate transport system substrate-binding protein
MFLGLTALLAQHTGLDLVTAHHSAWEDRMAGLVTGTIDVGWICGAQLAMHLQTGLPLVPLAAPVQIGERYADQPIYFSDIVVRDDAPFQRFEDLHRARFVYNEPTSWSGCLTVRRALRERGLSDGFFASIGWSGGHALSLSQIAAGQADAASIDSTGLELIFGGAPALARQFRVVHTLGPSPRPPWVAQRALPEDVRNALTEALCSLHLDPVGRAVLASGRVARFAPVSAGRYISMLPDPG